VLGQDRSRLGGSFASLFMVVRGREANGRWWVHELMSVVIVLAVGPFAGVLVELREADFSTYAWFQKTLDTSNIAGSQQTRENSLA
jgi:hypothetical protein